MDRTTAEWGHWIQSHRTYTRTDPVGRLLARVTVDPATGCWITVGSQKNGYPVVSIGHDDWIYGHRLMYEHHNGKITANKPRIHHVCETRACVNPAHLLALSAQDHLHEHGRGVGPCRKCGADDWHIRKDNGVRQCRECRRRRRAAC